MADNPAVRRYRTAGNIDFHCDAADVVGLLCLQDAKSGGQSRIASSVTIYNEVVAQRPDLAARLFEPFNLDLRGEHAPGARPVNDITPCAYADGRLSTFWHSDYFRSADRHDEVTFTEAERALMDLYDGLAASPDIHLDMWLQPGDMQFISNHVTVHARTAYEDWPDMERRRHLLRLWLSLV
ncbi:MAG: TauD/TfdA family dioxygenase [Alphaproteobacteria bacterium]